MRYPEQYPTGTHITCVLVTGDAHGQKHLRSPQDATGFRMVKARNISPRFFSTPDDIFPEISLPEFTEYEPFLEMSSRDGFIRLLSPSTQFGSRAVSFLQIADALRIAGIEEIG